MSLDFAVLGHSGAPEKSVSLKVDLHHELVAVATARRLKCFQEFADYYEDAEIAVEDLSALAEQTEALRVHGGGSAELQCFLGALKELIAYAVAQRRTLHAIAD